MLKSLSIPWKKLKDSRSPIKPLEKKVLDGAIHSSSCEHDWQFVQERREPLFRSPAPETQVNVLCYCPLCKTSQIFSNEDWEALQKIQDIRKKYKK